MITVVGHNAIEVGVHLARLSGGLVDPPSGPLGLVAVHPSAASHTQSGIEHRFVSALALNPTNPLGLGHGELLRTATLFQGVSGKKQAGAARVSVKAAEQAISGAVETMPQLKDGNDRATAHQILRHYVLPALGLNQEFSRGVHLQPRRPELFHLTAESTTPEAAAQHIWDFYRSHPERAARPHEAEQTLRALLLPSAGACPACRMVGRSDAFAAPVCATCLHGVAVAHITAPTHALAGTDLLWGRSAAPVKQAPPQPSPYEDVVVAKEPAADTLKPILEKLQSTTSRDVGGVRLPAKDVPDANAFATLCAHAAKLEFLKKAHVYASDSAAQRTSVIALTDSLGAGKSYATNYYTLADKFAVDLGDLRVARLVLSRLANGDRKAPSDTIDVTIRQWKVDKAPHEANEIEVTVSHKTLTTTQPDISASQIATELMKLVGTPATEPASVRLNTGVSGPGRLSLSTAAGSSGVKTASVPFDPAAGIKVTAAADPGARFAQWRGDCSGSDPVCELKAGQLDHDANVTAVFTPAVTVNALPAHVGDRQVEVQFQAPAKEFQPTKWDWVGWFKVGADDKGYLTWDWTHKQANGKLRLKAPTKAASGEYELRYYTYDKKYTPVARVPFMLRPGTVQDLLPELSSAARPDTLLTKGVPTDADMAQRLKTRASGIVVRSQTANMAGDDGVFQRIASAVTNLNFFPDDQATLTAVALPVAVDSVFAITRPLVPNDKAAGSPHVVTYYDVLETALEEGSDGKLFRFVAAARPDSLISAGITVSLKSSGGKIDLFVEKRQEHGTLLKKFLSEAEHEETVERNVASLLHHLTVAGHNAAH